MGNAREAGSLRVGRWTGGMWAGFVGGGARRTVVGVEGARGWYVSRCLRMELSRRRLSWSWSLFTWRRELRIPSLGARAGGYATAPSERTAKAADSLLAEPRLVVWSRTTSLPPPLSATLQGVFFAKLTQHMSKSPLTLFQRLSSRKLEATGLSVVHCSRGSGLETWHSREDGCPPPGDFCNLRICHVTSTQP